MHTTLLQVHIFRKGSKASSMSKLHVAFREHNQPCLGDVDRHGGRRGDQTADHTGGKVALDIVAEIRYVSRKHTHSGKRVRIIYI